MATNEATWSNKRTLTESVDVTLRNSDDTTELTHHILEDIEEVTFSSTARKLLIGFLSAQRSFRKIMRYYLIVFVVFVADILAYV